jgi:hypothetical protein
MELLEKLPEPTSFSHIVGHGAILSLNARSEDNVLALGGPGDELVRGTQHSLRWTDVYPVNLLSLYPSRPSARRRRRSIVGGGRSLRSLQITQDVLHRSEVRLSGIMHMKANL